MGGPGATPRCFRPPVPGDRISVLQRQWLDLLLSGGKTMEVRSRNLGAGVKYYLGHRGRIYGSVVIAEVEEVGSVEHWRALLSFHMWDVADRPYQRTYAHRLSKVLVACSPVPYQHPRGAVGLVRYRG